MQNMRNSISQKIIKAKKTDMDIRRNDIRGNRAEGNDNAGKADIAVAGLAVMGANLALNMESKGFHVAVYNRTEEKLEEFMVHRAQGRNFIPARSPEELCPLLKRPRRIMMMVKAGAPVDELIARFLPALEPGDILIDGGNSHFTDTERRCRELAGKGIRYLGVGISGGEEGALHGPSIMPGGNGEAWPYVRDLFRAIAARAGGKPCCEWIGPGGAGHFVKMLHNGIEYADMQMISEAYLLLRDFLGLSVPEVRRHFERWNSTELNSYLIGSAADLLKVKDPATGRYVIDVILDVAGQKGTGKWTVQSALDLAMPAATIAEAVFARFASALRDERLKGAALLPGPERTELPQGKKRLFPEKIRKALFASKICAYAQGFQLLEAASEQYSWNLDFARIALLWRGGCIIRADFLDDIAAAFRKRSGKGAEGKNALMLAPFFRDALTDSQSAWREVTAEALKNGLPVPAFSSALTYYDSMRAEQLPANMLQALRDYFGAHGYERTDRPRGEFFHTQWTSPEETGKDTGKENEKRDGKKKKDAPEISGGASSSSFSSSPSIRQQRTASRGPGKTEKKQTGKQ